MNIINAVILIGLLLVACIIAWQILKATIAAIAEWLMEIIVSIIEWFDDTPPGFT